MIVRNSTLGAHLAGAAPWSSTGARTTTPNEIPAGTTPVLVYTSDDYFPAGVGPAPAEPFVAASTETRAPARTSSAARETAPRP